MAKNYLLIYLEPIAIDIELMCQSIKVPPKAQIPPFAPKQAEEFFPRLVLIYGNRRDLMDEMPAPSLQEKNINDVFQGRGE